MNRSVRFGDYIIDPETLQYRAVWNCQVDFTDDCIYYDAEVGRLELDEEELVFSCIHKLQVTKTEYKRHESELKETEEVDDETLIDLLSKQEPENRG